MTAWNTGGIFKGAAVAGALAGVVNVALYFLGGALGAAYLVEPPGGGAPEPIPFFMPFVMSLVPALLGAVLLVGLTKITKDRAWPIFLGVLIVAFVAMLPGPVVQLHGDMVATIVLELMHVVLVVAVFFGIRRFGRSA